MNERDKVSNESEELHVSEPDIKPSRYRLFHLPKPRVVFPILTIVSVGYAGLVSARPHWASDLMSKTESLIESLFVGK